MDKQEESCHFWRTRYGDVLDSIDVERLDAGQEDREQYLLLIDYLEFFTDPAGWYVKTEHPCLGG